MTYEEYIKRLGEVADDEFTAAMPQMIKYAELRIYRELELLCPTSRLGNGFRQRRMT